MDDHDDRLEFNFNTERLPRGQVLKSWDILIDEGKQGLEITLPQLIRGTCTLQTISSLSFGSKGGKSADLDITTALGENHYISCGKGVTMARRRFKREYKELGFTKAVHGGRAVYINTSVTVGPPRHVMIARILEHATKRAKRKKTRRQRATSKAKRQMTAMGIMLGGMRADSLREGDAE